MSNPTFRQGPISYKIANDLDQFHLVAINAEGKIDYADAEGPVFGAITEDGKLDYRAADNLPVHYGVAAVYLKTSDEIAAGAPVFAGANGVAAAAGTVQVGVAAEASNGSRVLTVLNGLPYSA